MLQLHVDLYVTAEEPKRFDEYLHILLVKLIKPSLQLQTSYFIRRDRLGAARYLNLKAGTGTVPGAFVFWTGSAMSTLNIITVEGDVLYSSGLLTDVWRPCPLRRFLSLTSDLNVNHK